MCARKRTELTLRDKVRLIKASSHRQLAVETDDDDDTSDSLSVIKKYSFHETMAAVSVLKDFKADRCLDDILHSMFNTEDKLRLSCENKTHRSTITHQFISPTAVSCSETFTLKKNMLLLLFFFNCA